MRMKRPGSLSVRSDGPGLAAAVAGEWAETRCAISSDFCGAMPAPSGSTPGFLRVWPQRWQSFLGWRWAACRRSADKGRATMLPAETFVSMLLPIALAAIAAWAALDQDDGLTVPNRYPAILVLLWPIAFIAGFGMPGMSGAAAHLGIGLCLLLAGYAADRAGAMGAGDAKLLAAIGLWAGPAFVGSLLAAVALAAGALAAIGLIVAGLRTPDDPLPPGYAGAVSGRAHRGPSPIALALKRTIPLAPALAVGAVATAGHLILAAAA